MERLHDLIGRERPLRETAQALSFLAGSLAPAVCGAVLVTCADETERECATVFAQSFAQHRLPALRGSTRAPMRLANLGGRYEWGTVRIAEDHFHAEGAKLIVVKLNTHVARSGGRRGEPVYGTFRRYGRRSTACGALNKLLSGAEQPPLDELAELFRSEGRDRLAQLRDPQLVPRNKRLLAAAIVAARLQARKAVLDIQDHTPAAPTRYLVVPCVTINGEHSGEIVCGVYDLRHDGAERSESYRGLGDDPAALVYGMRQDRLLVEDPGVKQARLARDHRAVAREALSRVRVPHDDARLAELREEVRSGRHRGGPRAKALLRSALPLLGEVAPVPVAMLLFADGAAGIHHAFKVHRLADRLESDEDAREVLHEVQAQLDSLDPDRAEALLERLFGDYGR